MNTQTQVEIIDKTGADDWDAVIEAFGDGSLEEIEQTLNDMFPGEDVSELAQMIFDEVTN